ncbi:MAG: hypothetical protein PHQ88_09555 [Bacteroides sp.]|nr:hypothetical protein [Bacteroides sp.]
MENKNRRRYRHNLKDKRGKYFPNDKLVYLAFFLKDETKGNWRNPIRYYAVDHIEHRLKEITVLGHSLGNVDNSDSHLFA